MVINSHSQDRVVRIVKNFTRLNDFSEKEVRKYLHPKIIKKFWLQKSGRYMFEGDKI